MPGKLEFGLLGPLVAQRDGTELPVGRGSRRVLLATLLLNANRTVSVDAIAEVLWGTEPPPSAPVALRNTVRRLRQALGEVGLERIATEPHGYRIRVADGELDLATFELLLASARQAARSGSWQEAAAQAREALSLWRGEPLTGVESETLAAREVPRLDELRLQAEELRLDAQLRLGSHAEAVAELGRLAASHPLREHVQALLMLALYRCGRQADALAAYQHARQVLVDELGTEPGSKLRKLHQQILAADPALDLPQPASAVTGPTGPGAGAGTIVARHAEPPVPRQLPATVAQFTGRTAELQALTETLSMTDGGPGTVVISAIGGTAGVGKTALALRFAHQAASHFPDGQLYVNLRGFDPGGAPASPAEAIRGFLDALGVAPERVPPGLDAQQGLYRSQLAGKQMLIVLDNAADEPQVRPLIPASPASLVLVTSRNHLTGLAASGGARLLTLDVLPGNEAREMLSARVGTARAAAEPEAVTEIARLCACLPLALAVTAARAAARPGFPLAAIAAELRDAGRRLDALDAGDPIASVSAVFSWSVQQLTPGAARMFRLLGLHPGPDISVAAAASLAGCGYSQARHLLAELARANLTAEHGPGRYAFHDLLRAYATDQVRDHDSDADRHEATARVLDHYLHTAHAAARLLYPARDPITLASTRPGVVPEQLADDVQARAWFAAELQVLLAVVNLAGDNGFDVCAWQIPWTMATFLDRRGHWQQLATTQRTAVAAAVRLGHTAGEAESRRLLAKSCSMLGYYDQARAHLGHCLELFRQLGDQVGEAGAHQSLGRVAELQSRYADALDHVEQALRRYQAAGHRAGQASALNNVGWCHALLGDYPQARVFCQQSVTLSSEIGDRRTEAHSWDSLGYAEHHLGHLAEAAACYRRALSIFRELGDRFNEAEILTHLGNTHQTSGELRLAREAWQQALEILDELQHPEAEQVRAKLAAADRDSPLGTAAADWSA